MKLLLEMEAKPFAQGSTELEQVVPVQKISCHMTGFVHVHKI